MYAMFKKLIFAFVLTLSVLTTGAWQGDQVVFAEKQNSSTSDAPLYSGLKWNNVGVSVRSITLNAKGEAISLSGETYQAAEQFTTSLPQDVLDYYSNEQLAISGWSSHDAVDLPGGVRKVFYHESGVYFSVEFQVCPDEFTATCITVWKSDGSKGTKLTLPVVSTPKPQAVGSFGKTSPANGTANINPASVVLSWGTFSPTPDKYSYCIKADLKCADDDPNWTGTFTNTSVTLTNLAFGKTYYWQVRAYTCASPDCVPKTFVTADGGTWWTFTTNLNGVSIVGNAGVSGATLSYTNVTPKTVTADSIGNYAISLPVNWSGTVTPTKAGYTFLPAFTSYLNLNAAQTISNYSATAITYNISGNAGAAGVTLSYIDSVLKTVTADGSGNYTLPVSYNWSGTVTPTKAGYTFLPVSKAYANILSNQAAQDYTATPITYTIVGNAGVALATLSYVDGVAKTVTADGAGNYLITVSYNWIGTVTPSKAGYTFLPVNIAYLNVLANLTGKNYAAMSNLTIMGNAGVAGVTLSYNDGGAKTVTADGTGNYLITVPYNWIGTVTPWKMGYSFTPVSRSYSNVQSNQTSQNYTAEVCAFCIFTDVPLSYWANSYIARLYNAGITSGCSGVPLNYCPEQTVTRAQMAVFLVRGMHGIAFTPPTATGIFTDVAVDSFGAGFIEQLFADGITAGCGANIYCPNEAVTRAQMAVFLVRAKHGIAFTPPTATGIFTDVPVGSFGASYIEQLVTDGITSGCSATTYCPSSPVTRAQMAVFMVKAFSLP